MLALVGALSVAAAIDLGQVLYTGYGWYFRGAAVLFAAVMAVRALRAHHAGSLGGVQKQLSLVTTLTIAMAVTYAAHHVAGPRRPVSRPYRAHRTVREGSGRLDAVECQRWAVGGTHGRAADRRRERRTRERNQHQGHEPEDSELHDFLLSGPEFPDLIRTGAATSGTPRLPGLNAQRIGMLGPRRAPEASGPALLVERGGQGLVGLDQRWSHSGGADGGHRCQ
jgi:hypothetical protein